MKRQRLAALLVMAIALMSLPCRNREGIKGLDLAVALSERNLTDNLYVDLTCTWKASADFKGIEGDRSILVRFDHGGELLTGDDYLPDVPTSQWQPGGEYVVTRKIFIPPFIDEFDPSFDGSETLILTVGISDASGTTATPDLVILRKKLRVALSPLTPAVLYMDGWYEPERDSAASFRERRWTGREARCLIDNPGRDSYLVIRGSVDREAVPGQEITIRIDGTVLERFVPEGDEFEKSYTIQKDVLGEKKDFFLSLSVDRTFVPAVVLPGSEDTRELGILVDFLYFK